MYISLLEIYGFRGIKSAQFSLKPHTVLLGPNNVGKSAIVDAVGLLLGRERLVKDLGDHDFFGSNPRPESRIMLKATIAGFEPNDPEHHPRWFNTNDGGIPLWWDSATFSVSPEKESKDAKLCIQVGFSARFDEETLEFETIRYFVDGEGDPFEDPNIIRVKLEHLKELGFFLLPSNRTWDRIISFASELFRKVLRFQDAVPGKAIGEVKNWLRSPPTPLEKDEQLRGIIRRVNDELAGFVGKKESTLQFRPTTGDIEGVLQTLFPYLKGKEETDLPLGRHGSGVISLQTLLLLFEFGRVRHEQCKNFILVTEEPELHLHPGHHRRLVGRIRGVSNQSITTTHSPEVVAYYRPEEITILRNRDGKLESIPLIAPDESMPDKNALMRLFTMYRAEICHALMHRIVLVPEGVTEFRWFNSLLRACVTAEGWSISGEFTTPQTVAVLPTQDSQVVSTYERFRYHVQNLLPIVDGDSAGDAYVKSLKTLKNPPSIVVQLPKDASIEHLIAWILSPSQDQEWQYLENLLDISSRSLKDFAAKLEENKTRWDIHEEIISMVAERQPAADRARLFFDAVSQLPENDQFSSTHWFREMERSNEKTTIWRFSFS